MYKSPKFNPPGKAWFSQKGSKVEFGASRYDGDLLTFQIIFFLIPCFVIFFFIDSINGFVLNGLALGAIIFWIISNFNNRIEFIIENGYLLILRKHALNRRVSIEITNIDCVIVGKKNGIGSGFAWHGTGRVVINELVIILKSGEEINLGSYFQDIHKKFFKSVIEFYMDNRNDSFPSIDQ